MGTTLDEVERCLLRPSRPRLAEALAVAAPYAPACRVCVGHPRPPMSCWSCLGSGHYLDDEACATDAWRALAEGGVIPRGWWDDPHRSFAVGPRPVERAPVQMPPALDALWVTQRAPRTVRACVAMASDPDGVAASEAAALRDANEGLSFGPVVPPKVERVMWRFVTDAAAYRQVWIERWRRDEVGARGFGRGYVEVLARGYRVESLPRQTVVIVAAELRP